MKHLLTLTALLSTLIIFSQSTSPLTRDWKVGDQFEVNQLVTRQEGEDMPLVEEEKLSYLMNVLAADDESVLVEVVRPNIFLEETDLEDEADAEFDTEDMVYRCKFYRNDPGMEVVNWEEISGIAQRAFGDINTYYEMLHGDEAFFITMMLEEVIEPFYTQTGITEMVTDDLSYLVEPYFLELEGDTLWIEDLCPNPMNSEVESSMVKAFWEEERDGQTVIATRTDIDMTALLAPMREMIMAMAMAFSDDPEAEMSEEQQAIMEKKLAELDAMQMEAVLYEDFYMGENNWPVKVESRMLLTGMDGGREREANIVSTITLTPVE